MVREKVGLPQRPLSRADYPYPCRILLFLSDFAVAPVSLSPRWLPYGVSGIQGEEHGEGEGQFCPKPMPLPERPR
jgi:hypothetical protein